MPELIVRKWDGPYSFMVFREEGLYKARRGDTAEIQFQDPKLHEVLNDVWNALTPGRTWKEKVVLKGNFEVPSTITLPSYTILEIQGKLRLADGAECTLIKVENAENVDIKGGILDGNKAGQTGAYNVIMLGGGSDYLIDGVKIINGSQDNIYIRHPTGVTVKNCYLGEAARNNLSITNGHRIEIIGNTFVGSQRGIDLEPNVDTDDIYDVIIADNEFELDDALFGVELVADKAPVHYVAVKGNVIRGGYKGVAAYWGCENVEISNNIIVDFVDFGVHTQKSVNITIENNVLVGKGEIGIKLSYAESKYNVVKGNLVVLTVDTDNIEYGILVDGATDSVVSGNIIRFTVVPTPTSRGVHLSRALRCIVTDNLIQNFEYPVREYSTADYNQIKHNTFVECAYGVYKLGANTEVEGNIGHVTENGGTATIPSGQTSVTFAHGLFKAPTFVVLGATHPEVADATWSADDTNLTITVPSAVSADRNISWYAKRK